MSRCSSSERGGLSPAFFSCPVARGPVPRATVKKKRAVYRRARACPSPCLGRENGLGWRSVFAQVERSRGTGPRATVCQAVSVYRRARACPSPCLDRHGKRRWLAFDFRVGRTIAGDRPPRYGPGRGSPLHAPFGIRCSRTTVSGARECSRGTGPRATVCQAVSVSP